MGDEYSSVNQELQTSLMRAQEEIERLRKLTIELAQLMMPFVFIMTSEEQEKVMKAVRSEQ